MDKQKVALLLLMLLAGMAGCNKRCSEKYSPHYNDEAPRPCPPGNHNIGGFSINADAPDILITMDHKRYSFRWDGQTWHCFNKKDQEVNLCTLDPLKR